MTIPIPKELVERLRKLWEDQGRPDGERLMFPSPRCSDQPRSPNSVLYRHIHPVCRQLNVQPVGYHAFRRGVATEQISAGVDPKTLQAWLGHKDVETTLTHYAQARLRPLQAAVEARGRILFKGNCDQVVTTSTEEGVSDGALKQ